MTNSRMTPGTWASIVLAAAISLFCMAAASSSAFTTSTDMEISDAKAAVAKSKYSLSEAQARLDEITDECEKLEAEVDEMQAKVDELAVRTMEAQQAMFEGREALGNTMQYNYRNDSLSAMLDVVLGSKDWAQFTKNVDYISAIMDKQNREIEEQKRLKSELEEVSSELTRQKNEQVAKLNELQLKRDEAQSVVDQVSDEVAANTEKLSELQAKAAAIAAAAESASATAGDSSASSAGEQVQGSTASPSSPSSTSPSSGDSGEDGKSAPIGSGWSTGQATAYDLVGNSTSSGEEYTEGSMGVAIDWNTPGYSSYFGRTVAITYNGTTVYATIVDVGNFAQYGVSLDLQRGVYRSLLGDSSAVATDWGRRTVSYRIM